MQHGPLLVVLTLQALKAVKAAESEVSKLNYRILHLVRSLQEADAKAAA